MYRVTCTLKDGTVYVLAHGAATEQAALEAAQKAACRLGLGLDNKVLVERQVSGPSRRIVSRGEFHRVEIRFNAEAVGVVGDIDYEAIWRAAWPADADDGIDDYVAAAETARYYVRRELTVIAGELAYSLPTRCVEYPEGKSRFSARLHLNGLNTRGLVIELRAYRSPREVVWWNETGDDVTRKEFRVLEARMFRVEAENLASTT